jgi:hypothetical protein
MYKMLIFLVDMVLPKYYEVYDDERKRVHQAYSQPLERIRV